MYSEVQHISLTGNAKLLETRSGYSIHRIGYEHGHAGACERYHTDLAEMAYVKLKRTTWSQPRTHDLRP
jgi:hypothetical protein